MLKTATTFVAILTATAAFAQDETARRQAVELAARVPLERAFKGAPYSAETIVESSQALADGNRISTKTTGRVYRDGEGRTRRETDNKDRTTISISDPVAGYSYSLDPVNKIAWRTATGAAAAIMGKIVQDTQTASVRRVEPVTAPDGTTTLAAKIEAEKVQAERARQERNAGSQDAASRAAAEQEKVAIARGGGGGRGGAVAGGFGAAPTMTARGTLAPNTPLEHRMLDGMPVEGRKTTTVIPAGQIGNEQPITITSEEWRSPDLNVLVQTRHSDPRTGESSYRLTNIIRAEPDPSLFMVPPDYTVRDTNIKRMLEASQRK
jgi:hypothetical protein